LPAEGEDEFEESDKRPKDQTELKTQTRSQTRERGPEEPGPL